MPLAKPTLAPRTSAPIYSQEKQFPTFATCPRSSFTAGQDGWLRITTPQPFYDVDICPTCYSTSFKDTKYARCFSAAPPKPPNLSTKCDLSNRWNRITYLWLFSQNAPDLSLLGTVAEMPHDKDGPCPNLNLQDNAVPAESRGGVTRTWYCLSDPSTGGLVEDLTVCSDCVARVKLIFPGLKGIFRPVANGQKVEATCDLLVMGAGGDRSEAYLNQLVDTASRALQTGTLDTLPLITYIKKWAPIPVCLKSNSNTSGYPYYTLPTSIPGYAACEECYTTHILPLLTSASSPPWLAEIQKIPNPHGFVCDLYSPRLQRFFTDACRTGDLATYRQRLEEREAKLREYNSRLAHMQLQVQQWQSQARMNKMQMETETNQARLVSMQWSASPWIAPPVDFSKVNAALHQMGNANLQAGMVQDNTGLLRREWANMWE